MYTNTRFADLLKGLPRPVFDKQVRELDADKHCKGFKSWDQLIALIYAQIACASSLREIETGFNSQKIHHYHLGTRCIRRSTLADANQKRPAALFERICQLLMAKVSRHLRQEVGEFLYLLDSTPIPLKGLGYDDWTRDNHNHRTQGLKVHVLMASGSNTPVQSLVSAPNINDIDVGRNMPIETGQTYVFDKGYCDYNWWYQIHCAGAYFVTRLKSNAGVQVLADNTQDSSEHPEILGDHLIGFKNLRPGGKRINQYHGTPLRRVLVALEDGRPALVIAKNDLASPANVITANYKARWGIELFFKWLKHNLSVRTFLGRSENAVKIQIFVALITYLLLQIQHAGSATVSSLRCSLTELRAGLFQRKETDHQLLHRRQRRQRIWTRMQGALPL
ncbi:IS4 family transposase [Ectopseudomonas mendocina]|nr:IS4 family transposase [Pseudomonas mendocina]TXR38448.1 IS4 family transposase [Pseudomonas mendocina]